ncbi:MAG TPA: hypothetical protein VKR29_08230 [Candidatus Binataceae bacterium]|jgi:hypothetical protein|nr:hypothetical protein [Candidatus Binataceae bacterium]
MSKVKTSGGKVSLPEPDGEENLVLMDDLMVVNALAQAALEQGRSIICVGCFDPSRALRAFVFRLEAPDTVDESAGSLGFCFDCYHDLMERVFHRGGKSTGN